MTSRADTRSAYRQRRRHRPDPGTPCPTLTLGITPHPVGAPGRQTPRAKRRTACAATRIHADAAGNRRRGRGSTSGMSLAKNGHAPMATTRLDDSSRIVIPTLQRRPAAVEARREPDPRDTLMTTDRALSRALARERAT